MNEPKTETIFHAVQQHAQNSPDKTALISGRDSVTYRDLAFKVNAIANGLLHAGVKSGDPVGITTATAIEHLCGSIAAMAAGAISVALPTTDRVACAAMLDDADPSLIIGDGLPEGLAEGRSVRSLSELVESGRCETRNNLLRRVEPEELAMIYYTSGTSSGIRKGVMQSYRALHNTAAYICQIMKLTGEAREFIASPLDNVFWFGRCRCVLKVGGTLLLNDGMLNPLAIIDSLRKNGGNSISGDTPIYLLLMKHLEKPLRQLGPSLRWVKIASQAMPRKEKELAIQWFPNARIVMNYGLTEAMRTALLPLEDWPEKRDSDGLPSPGVSLKIAGPDGVAQVPGTVGEVCIAGANLASGYWRKEAMWAEKFDGTWYKTGDLGMLDSDGFLFLLGRKDHAINSGGRTIAPQEVTTRLESHLSGMTFVVCGIPDPNEILGEIVVVCVEGKWELESSWKDLKARLAKGMDSSLVPKEVYLMSKFPRTANGKIQLGTIRESILNGVLEKL